MDKILIERGYKQYPPTAFDSDIVVDRFQKRFDDEYGKKYFINVVKRSQDFIPESQRGEWWKPFSYSYEIQVTVGKEEKAINMEFFKDWTVEDVEKFVEKMFNAMQVNYYELWDSEERQARPEA